MGARCCGGSRTAGGAYIVLGLSRYGKPIEDFLIDPPKPVPEEMEHRLGIKDLGMTWMQVGDTWHLLDVIGQKHYKNVADWIEETRRMGISRKVSTKLDFSRLTPDSRLIVLHRRALIKNGIDYFRAISEHSPCPEQWLEPASATNYCITLINGSTPRKPHGPTTDTEMCATLWYHDVQGAEMVKEGAPHLRELPCGRYQCFPRPAGVTPEYGLAIFGSFPIGGIEVIRDKRGGTHERAEAAVEAARRNGVYVETVDE